MNASLGVGRPAARSRNPKSLARRRSGSKPPQVASLGYRSPHVAVRGDSLPESLTPVEWARYARSYVGAYNIWEHAFFSFRSGTLDPELWSGWDRSYSAAICRPGVQRFWKERAEWYGDSFQRHVAEQLAVC